MTLALAMVCEDGILLAADTRIAYQDGTIGDMQKLTGFFAEDGMFTVAHSSHDANAADSLIRMIRERIERLTVGTFTEMEHKIEDAMRDWYVPVHDDRPTIQLLLAACLQSTHPERALYLCEPPNTVSRVWDHYKAIGDGWRVSDPIYRWFHRQERWPAHACLCQISYMMYRAKTLHPGSIGGETDAALLTDWQNAPRWILRFDMARAEAYGRVFDQTLSDAASVIVGKVPRSEADIRRIGEKIHSCGYLYKDIEFHCQFEHETIRQ